MNPSPPAKPSPKGAKPADTPVVEPGFEIALQEFWIRNRNFILSLCAIALLVIAGREGWQYFSNARERELQSDYAKAGDNADRLVKFADAHQKHVLAGVAYLRAADDKFSTGDYRAAITYYRKAAENLKNEALLGRAKLGEAVSHLASGDQAGGEAALKALSTDSSVFKSARAEAIYHLASIAAGAGRIDEARKLAEQLNQVEASGPWAQRATMLVAGLPAEAAKPDAAGQSVGTPSLGISFKPTIPDQPAEPAKSSEK